MHNKMTTNSQLLNTEPKKKKQTKQTPRTGTESQKCRSHNYQQGGGYEGTVTENKHKW